MFKARKNMLILLLTGMLVLFYTAVPVSAASSVKISGGTDVAVGDSFTLTVVFQGDSVGSVSANLKYDKNVLEYVSGGSSSGNTGFVYLEKDVVNEEMSFQLQFKAKSQGNTTVSVETYEMYDMDYNYMGTPSTSRTLEVAGSSVHDEETTEPSEEILESGADSAVTDELGMTENNQETNELNPWLLGGIAAVLILLIVLIAVKLKRNK